jgi:hypothetical protein
MGWVGEYTLRVFCNGVHVVDGHREFIGTTRGDAIRKARAAGWTLNVRAGKSYCRVHAKRHERKDVS